MRPQFRRAAGTVRGLWLAALAAMLAVGCASGASASDTTADAGQASPPEMSRQERDARIDALTRQGLADLASGRLRDAVRRFREILQLAPNRAQAWVQLATVLAQLGDRQEAVESLRQAAQAGYLDFDSFRDTPELMPLHGFGPFERLLRQREEYVELVGERRLASLRRQFGDSYVYRLDKENRLLVATDRPAWMVDAIIETLSDYATAHWRHTFTHRPSEYLTVLIPSRADFESLLSNPLIGGVYVPERRLLIAREPDYMLRHEFTHFLHFADLDAYPRRQNIWFLEGIATLFENSIVEPDTQRIVPVPNSRQNLLRLIAAQQRFADWSTMMAMEPARFMQDAPALYAQVRYICWWLLELGKLREFHETYAATVEDDPTGIAALERVLGMPLNDAQHAWERWVTTEVPYFFGLAEEGRAFLGMHVRADEHGLTAVGTLPDGPAGAAGLRVGDRLIRFEQRLLITREDLMDELLARQPGDTVRLTVGRGGETRHVLVTLGSVPRDAQAEEPEFEQPRIDLGPQPDPRRNRTEVPAPAGEASD